MKWVVYLCVISSVAAFVNGGNIPEEEIFGEVEYGDIDYPRLTRPYDTDFGSISRYESDFEYGPPRESRTRFRQRNDNRRRNNNRDPTETNDITSGDPDLMALLFRPENSARRVAFIRKQQERLENSRKFYDDSVARKKREANPDPWGSRPKRTHCSKCGGGGDGGYGGYGGGYQTIPVYAIPVPVYGGGFGGHGGHGGHGGYLQKPSYGGGGKGCNTCGGSPGFGGHGGGLGGHGGYLQKPSYGGGGKGCSTCGGSPGFGGHGGGLGGHGGSFSQSWSQSSSSSNSWGYGKK